MKMLILLFAFFMFQPLEYTGKIVYVMDGNTFVLQTGEGNLKIRMDGSMPQKKTRLSERNQKHSWRNMFTKNVRSKLTG